MCKTVYMVTCGSIDEDGECKIAIEKIEDDFDDAKEATEQLCAFLGQTDETYIDEMGFVHEIYEGKDQLFGKYLDDIDQDTIAIFYDQLRELGRQDVIDVIEEQIQDLRV